MAEWNQLKIGEMLKLEYGKPLPKDQRIENGRFPAFGSNGEKCRTNDAYWDSPSIIVGRKGSAGELKLVDGGFWPLDVTYYVVFDENEYALKFLYYMLMQLNLPSLAKGVKPGLNRNEVYAIDQRFPLLPEQHRIVAILDEAFAAIATATANAEQNLDNARDLFKRKLNLVYTNHGDDWSKSSLDNLCEITHGFTFKGKDFRKDNDINKPIVITPGNFTEDASLMFTEKNTKRFTGEAPKRFTFDIGDLAIVMTDLSSKMKILGKPAFIELPNILHNQRIGRLRIKDNSITRRYLYYFFQTNRFLDNIKKTATGTMVKHTAPKRILSNQIFFPTVVQQENLVEHLDILSTKTSYLKNQYQRKLTLLAEFKQSILQKAFSGELTADPKSVAREFAKAGV